jgi:hypothetical protein
VARVRGSCTRNETASLSVHMCPHATVYVCHHITISHVTAATTPYSARPSCSLTAKVLDLGAVLAVSMLFGSGTSDGRDAIFELFSFSFLGIEFRRSCVLV